MLRKSLIILSLFLNLGLWAQTSDGSNLRISLLTCSKGDDIASDFGHSAIRVKDTISGQDIVFNYGTYDFEAPHFVLKFMRGQMDYLLSACYYQDFIRSYLLDNRAVSERELLLAPDDRMKVYATLVNAWQGPGRRYRYDYFRNNCATKIRDILLGSTSVIPELSTPEHTPEYTFRTAYGNLYLYDVPWLMFGLDMLMGSLLDRPISFTEEMYLPCLLESNLSECAFLADGKPLLSEREILLENEPVEKNALAECLTSPVAVFSALCAIFVLLFLVARDKRKMVRISSSVIHVIIGLVGVLMLFMWFGTEHYWTGANWNLLWASPLYLIPVFMRGSRTREWFIYVLTGISVLTMALQCFIPQHLNWADMPIVVLLVLTAAGTLLTRPSTYKKSKYKR